MSEARPSYEELRARVGELETDLAAARARETAMAQVLRAISLSPGDVASSLANICGAAAKLCEADHVSIVTSVGDRWQAWDNVRGFRQHELRAGVGSFNETAIATNAPVHVAGHVDTWGERFPVNAEFTRADGLTEIAALTVPLRTSRGPIGSLMARRHVATPFSDHHIALLETFADQAVIAIENARLFNELEERNREVTEALDQQAGVSEVLRVIGKNPSDVDVVFASLAETLRGLVDADFGYVGYQERGRWRELSSRMGHFNEQEYSDVPPDTFPPLAAARRREPVLFCGSVAQLELEYPDSAALCREMGEQESSVYAVPIVGVGDGVGVVSVHRTTALPFSEREMALVKTFADQAVIAIENARLFNELQERNREVTDALEREHATAEVMAVVGASAADAQPVFRAIVERAAPLFDAEFAALSTLSNDTLMFHVAKFPGAAGELEGTTRPLAPGTAGYDAVTSRQPLRFFGTEDELALAFPEDDLLIALWHELLPAGPHGLLFFPLLRAGEGVGVLHLARRDRPFSDEDVATVRTFADQAVIAIENARLFNELQERNREVTEALEREEATSQILGLISTAPRTLDTLAGARRGGHGTHRDGLRLFLPEGADLVVGLRPSSPATKCPCS